MTRLADLLNPVYVYHRRQRILPCLGRMVKRIGAHTMRIPHRIAALGFPVTANTRKLAALKDCHRGQRCFIIGNGPSLRIEDLDELKNEITFAFNKIYLAFSETEFRPTYYMIVDRVVAENIAPTVQSLQLTKIFPDFLRGKLGTSPDTIYYLHDFTSHNGESFHPQFSSDALDRVYGGYTVAYVGMQFAYYMGCNEVYLIGMDHTFTIPKQQTDQDAHGKVLVSQGEVNHFHPDYRPKGETWTIPELGYHEEAYKVARGFFEQNHRVIYNVTRGGKLKVFPHKPFDQVISKPADGAK